MAFLDLKKWTDKVNKRLFALSQPQYTYFTTAISNSTAVAKGAYHSYTANVAREGYTPLGIVGIQKGGSSSGYCVLSQYYLSGTTVNVAIMNAGTGSATPNFTVTCIYRKNDVE